MNSPNASDKSARQLFAPDIPITNTRDRITATALNLFYEHGFHGVGLDQVISQVGVTKTTFYNHFESKDELIIAAIQMRDQWEAQAFEKTISQFSDGSPKGTILAIFQALDQWFNDPSYAGCLFINACAEFPSTHDPVHIAAASHYIKVGQILTTLCEQVGAKDPKTLAQQLELLSEGAVTMRLISGNNTAAKSAGEIARALLDQCVE